MGFKSQSLNSLWFPFSIKQIFLSIYLERFWFLFLPIEPSIRLIGLVAVFVSPWHHRTIIGHLQREKSRKLKIFLQFEKWFATKAAGERASKENHCIDQRKPVILHVIRLSFLADIFSFVNCSSTGLKCAVWRAERATCALRMERNISKFQASFMSAFRSKISRSLTMGNRDSINWSKLH